MKTEEQIKARIEELKAKMELARNDAAKAGKGVLREAAEMRIYRLEGNIGALEWVMRHEQHPLIDHFDGDGKPVYK